MYFGLKCQMKVWRFYKKIPNHSPNFDLDEACVERRGVLGVCPARHFELTTEPQPPRCRFPSQSFIQNVSRCLKGLCQVWWACRRLSIIGRHATGSDRERQLIRPPVEDQAWDLLCRTTHSDQWCQMSLSPNLTEQSPSVVMSQQHKQWMPFCVPLSHRHRWWHRLSSRPRGGREGESEGERQASTKPISLYLCIYRRAKNWLFVEFAHVCTLRGQYHIDG